jgi:uncharacterized repeat protein (TIGR03847 family)
VLEIEELLAEADDDGPDDDETGALLGPAREVVQLAATREQMFALSRHGATVVEAGRPACRFCGNPMDAEGHACPAMNGHSKRE